MTTYDRNDGFIVDGEDPRERMKRIIALRRALKAEIIVSQRMRGRKSARSIAQDFLGLLGRPDNKTVYAALNKYIVNQLGPNYDLPLDAMRMKGEDGIR